MAVYFKVADMDRGAVIADRAAEAASIRDRLLGLIGRKLLEPGAGLWLKPCAGIHTFGMRFPIDVIILDRSESVLAVIPGVPPNRIILPRSGGASVLELPAGAASGVEPGAHLTFEPSAP